MQQRGIDTDALWLSIVDVVCKSLYCVQDVIPWHPAAFELFGYDFMMDDDLKLAMIEVNTNPCLETESSPLLSRLISQVVDQTFKVAVDPLFDGNENDIGLS